MSLDYSLEVAQSWYDNDRAAGTNMTYQQELRAEQAEQNLREELDEEYSNCDLALSFTDLRAVFPNVTAFEFQRLRRVIIDRVLDERKESVQ
jgi:hypothetical protein